MIFRPIKVGTRVIPHFRVILAEKSISYTILMFQGHSQGQKSNFKVNNVKILFLRNSAKNMCNTSFLWDFYRRIHL